MDNEEIIKDEDGIVIDHNNFGEYFFDARKFGPKKGQVMAKFTAIAVFGAGVEKQNIIKLMKMDKAHQAAQVMQKIHLAKPPDCYRVLREICEDLLSGMSDEEVEKKEYQFLLEAIFYTKKEYVPKRDPHWETIAVLQYDKENNKFISNIEL
jgi:hypothetical protein